MNLLIISSKPEDVAFAEAVAEVTKLDLLKAATPAEGAEIIDKASPKVIFADVSSLEEYQAFETAVADKIGLFSEKLDANFIHFLTSEALEKTPYLISSPLFGHFVLKNFGDPKEDGRHYGRIIAATLGTRAFGLDTLLRTGAKIQTVKLQSSSQKQGAVEAIRNYLLAAKFQPRMAAVIANAVDEILMNSMFDAPVDDLGRAIYAATARSAVLKLEGKHAVEVQIGFDGKYAAITAVDFFGSLDKSKLLAHISKIYVEEEYKVKHSVAGAGIGLATVFRTGGSFFFASESRVKTEVTVMFRRTDSFKEFRDQFRFISTQFYF